MERQSLEGLVVIQEDTTWRFRRAGAELGSIEGSPQTGYDIYGPTLEEGERRNHLNTEPIEDLNQAEKRLIDFILETSHSEDS